MKQPDPRETLLRIAKEISEEPTESPLGRCHNEDVLLRASQELGLSNLEEEQDLLTIFYDLFRTGHLSWGYSVKYPEFSEFHITDRGKMAAARIRRDPGNPAGYLAYLDTKVTLNHVARDYMEEALSTFSAGCFKATAVMVGCAAESTAIELRDAIRAKQSVPTKKLKSWKAKEFLSGIKAALDKQSLPSSLKEPLNRNWVSLSEQIRTARNDAGHPSPISSVDETAAHCALLIFPELAKLTSDLITWVNASYK